MELICLYQKNLEWVSLAGRISSNVVTKVRTMSFQPVNVEQYSRSNLSRTEIATLQEEYLRLAKTIICFGCPFCCSKARYLR